MNLRVFPPALTTRVWQVVICGLLICCANTLGWAQTEEPWNRLYITNFSSEDVHVIDLNREETIAKIKTGSGPTAMAVSPQLDKVYVANFWSGTVSVINTASNEISDTIQIPCDCAKSDPFGLALTHDGAKLYVSNLSDGSIRVVDTVTLTVTGKITGAYDWALRYMAISPDGEYLWAAGTGEGRLTVIRTSDDQVVTRIEGIAAARHLAFTPDGTRVYVTSDKYSRLYVLDAKEFSVIKVIRFKPGSITITVDICRDGKFAAVSNFHGKPSIVDIDPTSPTYHQIVKEIPPMSNYQYCIAVAPDGRFAYLTNQSDRGRSPNSLNVIDLRPDSPTRHTIIKSLPLGTEPWGIAIVKQTPPQPATQLPNQ
jgi:YVTN family beta-propeller protein